MQLRFDSQLQFQLAAVHAVADVFLGQEISRVGFSDTGLSYHTASLFGQSADGQSDLGVGNQLCLTDDDILRNVRQIQLRNGLAPTEQLQSLDFTLEMETGTGKTYVYLRTIFELHKRYGFTKFIIVVPSLAIREGVYKTLQITKEHFHEIYGNVPCDYFVYDSKSMEDVRNFATNDYIQIMVINIDAFRKSFDDPSKQSDANLIHRPHEQMNGRKPIEVIQATNPVVVVDEPQSVDTTPKSQAAIRSLNPLCTLRYSATHIDKHSMLYKLDSVDAYEQKLVKQIEVAGITIKGGYNRPFIRLVGVGANANRPTAKLELDIRSKTGAVQRKVKTVRPGTDLEEVAKRSCYEGFIVDNIHGADGNEYISFTSQDEVIRLGQAIGEGSDLEVKRQQIRKTIERHLDKQLQLQPRQIKVLSLFFIDKVANYRKYEKNGTAVDGPYALIFDEEYRRAVRQPKYDPLFVGRDRDEAMGRIRDGYFAIDKRKVNGATVEMYKESRGDGTTAADESAYKLIMRDKERLLDLKTPLQFIFSHSALREGWDNPNVFQICTLSETVSTIKKRQEIGRGLRIAVNQDGERVYGFDVNTLTVMANEAYEQFAEKLQKEIEDDEGVRFGVVENGLFANIVIDATCEQIEYLGSAKSAVIVSHLRDKGFVDERGAVQDLLRTALIKGAVDLPEEFSHCYDQIVRLLKRVTGRLNIRDAAKAERVELNKRVMLDPRFQEIWDGIKHKTTFRVDFDPQELVKRCAAKLAKDLSVGKARFIYRTSILALDRGGITTTESPEKLLVHQDTDFPIPDIVTFLQNETQLTRRTIAEILTRSGKLHLVKKNPQRFLERATAFIKDELQLLLVDGIKYRKIGDQEMWAQELFESEELIGYLGQNLLKSKKSLYEHVVYDSDVEEHFAKAFEQAEDVKIYAKLPQWFKIATPLGSYNPDWAVVVEADGVRQLYFVVETKGSQLTGNLRGRELAKIECGRAHFTALGADVEFAVVDDYDAFSERFIADE